MSTKWKDILEFMALSALHKDWQGIRNCKIFLLWLFRCTDTLTSGKKMTYLMPNFVYLHKKFHNLIKNFKNFLLAYDTVSTIWAPPEVKKVGWEMKNNDFLLHKCSKTGP